MSKNIPHPLPPLSGYPADVVYGPITLPRADQPPAVPGGVFGFNFLQTAVQRSGELFRSNKPLPKIVFSIEAVTVAPEKCCLFLGWTKKHCVLAEPSTIHVHRTQCRTTERKHMGGQRPQELGGGQADPQNETIPLNLTGNLKGVCALLAFHRQSNYSHSRLEIGFQVPGHQCSVQKGINI